MKPLLIVTGMILLLAPRAHSQQPTAKLEFDVASIKLNKAGLGPNGVMPNSNFPLGPGDVYYPNGGLFSAINQRMLAFLVFAYKDLEYQLQYLRPQLPDWIMDRYDIQARAQGNTSKEDMRMMMRALLAERCKLAFHYETREVPVLALVLDKPGKLGRQLRAHPPDQPCSVSIDKPGTQGLLRAENDGFPTVCGGFQNLTAKNPTALRQGARNVTMALIASNLTPFAMLGHPLIDRTGLNGTYDFMLEWSPDNGPSAAGDDFADQRGPSFQQALKDQLGLKLEAQKGSLEIMIIDHIERPSEN